MQQFVGGMYALAGHISYLELSTERNSLKLIIMKMQKLRTSNWKSFLSVLVLGVFVLLAVGSDPDLANI